MRLWKGIRLLACAGCVLFAGATAQAQSTGTLWPAGPSQVTPPAWYSSGDWNDYRFQLIQPPAPRGVQLLDFRPPRLNVDSCSFSLKSFGLDYSGFTAVKDLFLKYPTKLLFLAMYASYSMIPVVPDMVNRVNSWSTTAAQFAMADCQQMATYASTALATSGVEWANRVGCRMAKSNPDKEAYRQISKEGPYTCYGTGYGVEADVTGAMDDASGWMKDQFKGFTNEKTASEMEALFGGLVGRINVQADGDTYGFGRPRIKANDLVVSLLEKTYAQAVSELQTVVKTWHEDRDGAKGRLAESPLLSKTPSGSPIEIRTIGALAYVCPNDVLSPGSSTLPDGECGKHMQGVASFVAVSATYDQLVEMLSNTDVMKNRIAMVAASVGENGAYQTVQTALEYMRAKYAYDPTVAADKMESITQRVEAKRARAERASGRLRREQVLDGLIEEMEE